MVECAQILAVSFIIALSGALMPGPLLTATISESAHRGWMAGPILVIGHSLLELALLTILLAGLGGFLQQRAVFITIALAGAAVLAWMAVGMLRSLPRLSLNAPPVESSSRRLIASGAILSLANPYWSFWWATIGMACIAQWAHLGFAAVAAFYIGHILGDLIWYTSVSAAISAGRNLMTDRVYRTLIGVCAAFLILFAGYFAYCGYGRIHEKNTLPQNLESFNTVPGKPL
jgi:threonine/homoserine/homoserine lactone efflux protein